MNLTNWEKLELVDFLEHKLDGLRVMVETDHGARYIWLDEVERTEELLRKVKSEKTV